MDKKGENGELKLRNGEGRDEWRTKIKEWNKEGRMENLKRGKNKEGEMEILNGGKDKDGENGELEGRKG